MIWRDGDAGADFGIDGEIELAASELTGLLVKVQVKSAANPRFTRAGAHAVPVDVAHMNYWGALHLPVVALLVDTTSERLFWTLPVPIVGESEARLVFTAGQCLNDDVTAFRQAMYQLARWPASTAVLDHVEHFIGVFLELQETIVGERDFGYGVNRAELTSIELLYDHVLRLRGVLGLTSPPVVSLPCWLDRSQYVEELYGHDYESELSDRVAGELLDYLRPIYLKTLIRLGEVTKHESVTHRRLASYAHSGNLEPDSLAKQFDPWLQPN